MRVMTDVSLSRRKRCQPIFSLPKGRQQGETVSAKCAGPSLG